MNHYKSDLELHPELEPYRSKIEASVKPYVEIKLTENNNLSLWQSKFGGYPYLPKNFIYPKNRDGEYLYLLAQINFSEVPQLDNFPNKGILQFYAGVDDLYGYPDRFRSLYFSEIELEKDNFITDFSFLPKLDLDSRFPINGCCALEFSKKFSPVSMTDYRFNIFDEDLITPEACEEYCEKFHSEGHKIGGYATSRQQDIREFNPDYEELLLQIDEDYNDVVNITWGFGGFSHFFINKYDLENRDFSDVLYYWE